MLTHQMGVPEDRPAHEGWVALRRGREHLAEGPGEHDRLVLQDRVQQPQGAQGQLQPPAAVRRGPAPRGEDMAVARRAGTALGNGRLTHGWLSLASYLIALEVLAAGDRQSVCGAPGRDKRIVKAGLFRPQAGASMKPSGAA